MSDTLTLTVPNSNLPTAKSYRMRLQLILIKFVSAVVDQSFDLYMINILLTKNQPIFAFFYLLTDLIPGLFTMWQRYQNANFKWNWTILALCCHPINMIVWPVKAAFDPSDYNIQQLEVR